LIENQKELLGACGLYCGVCSIYIAHKNDNLKFKNALMKVYKPFVKTVDDIKCTGCRSSGEVFPVCKACPIKKCCKSKEIEGCYQCDDFPCKYITNYPVKLAREIILRSIPSIREMGVKDFIQAEIKRYTCPNCGNSLFRGVKRCNSCKIELNVDL